jgi:hypothetical protein
LAHLADKFIQFSKVSVPQIVQFNDVETLTQNYKNLLTAYNENMTIFSKNVTNNEVFQAIEDIEPVFRAADLFVRDRVTEITQDDINLLNIVHTDSQIIKEIQRAKQPVVGQTTANNMDEETPVQATVVVKMKPITLKEAHELIKSDKVPEGYSYSVQKYSELVASVEKNLTELLAMDKENSTYGPIKKRVNFLRSVPFTFSEEFSTIVTRLRSAKEFISSLFKKRPVEITETLEKIDKEYTSLNMVIEEYQRFLEDVQRDRSTFTQVENIIKEGFQQISLDSIVELRHLYKAARYFKNPQSEIKLVDIHIMAVIKAYNNHDHKTDPTVIDFLGLKDLYTQIKIKDTDEKEKKIKPDNAAFMVRLFEKCKQFCKKNIDVLNY